MNTMRRSLETSLGPAIRRGPGPSAPAPSLLVRLGAELASLGASLADGVRAVGQALRIRRERPLVLDMPERTVTFNSLEEFEFALASRTEFPVRKIAALMDRPPEELKEVATQIRQVEKRFADVLTLSLQEPGLIGELMREIELKLFSQDHGWRDVVEALNRQSPAFDAHRRVALVKYMQYLGSRQDVLRSIYLDKIHGDEAFAGLHDAGARRADTGAGSMGETAIFEFTQLAVRGGVDDGVHLVPMPRGETVCVRFNGEQPIDLQLSAHRFRLCPGSHFHLVDEKGNHLPLRPGKNIIGRHESADVVVDQSHRSVSRKHLIIEPVAADMALLTDISSHGTMYSPP